MIWFKYTPPSGIFYQHRIGECDYSVEHSMQFTKQDVPMWDAVTIRISGLLVGASTNAINIQVALLKQAIVSGGDIEMKDNSLGTIRNLELSFFSRQTLAGIRVTRPPSFGTMKGSAYVTYLPYSYELACELPVDGAAAFVSWNETIKRSGGGPVQGVIDVIRGNPVPVQRREKSKFRATQSGSAVGLLATPFYAIPAPIWPQWLVEAPETSDSSGDKFGILGAYRNFACSWKYDFEATEKLNGSPNNQPG